MARLPIADGTVIALRIRGRYFHPDDTPWWRLDPFDPDDEGNVSGHDDMIVDFSQPAPNEPPDGAAVIDASDLVWQRRGAVWVAVGDPATLTWAQLWQQHGPLRLLTPRVAAVTTATTR